jgi:hypothetical protein
MDMAGGMLPIRGRVVATLIMLLVYFGVILIREWVPSIGSTGPFFLYMLSLPLALLGLLGLGVWGGIGWLSSPNAGSPTRRRHRARLLVSFTGLLVFGSFWGLSATIRGALPTGSHLLPFDRSAWLDPASSEPVKGDITPRQKMLANVVNHVLPGRDRREVENLLGRSLETLYFKSTGRDLIYILGPERDSLMRLDSEWFLIWFDASGRLRRYEIYTD